MENDLWRFFFEYWDDNIIAPSLSGCSSMQEPYAFWR